MGPTWLVITIGWVMSMDEAIDDVERGTVVVEQKHLWQPGLRPIVADLTVIVYLTLIRENCLARFYAHDVVLTYAGAFDLIDSGTTTVFDLINGVVQKRNGELVAADWSSTREGLTSSSAYLVAAA